MFETTKRTQLWSRAGVEAVLNAPGLSIEQITYVCSLIPKFHAAPDIDTDTLRLPVKYFKHSNVPGRQYESPRGLQAASSIIRRICSSRHYRDWGIENAFPVILEGRLRAAGIPCPNLRLYTTMREECLSNVSAELHVPRATAKALFLRIIHCENWQSNDSIAAGATHPLLDSLSTEIHRAARTLSTEPEYIRKRHSVETDLTKINKMGSFLALVCQTDQDTAITAIVDALLEQDEQADVLMFNGVVSRSITHRPIDVVELSRRASQAIHIHLVVREKSFGLLASDLEVLRPEDIESVLHTPGTDANAQASLLAAK
jgi:hypothetical protein